MLKATCQQPLYPVTPPEHALLFQIELLEPPEVGPGSLCIGCTNRQRPHTLEPACEMGMQLLGELNLHCSRACQVRKKCDVGNRQWSTHILVLSELPIECVINA